MPDGYSEYWERYKAGDTARPTTPVLDPYWGTTPEAERHGRFPGSMEDWMYRQSLRPREIREFYPGIREGDEAETAREIYGLQAEISDWAALRESLNRPVDRIARWLAGLEMDRVREELRRVKEQADISRYKRELVEGEYKFGEWGAPAGERVTGGPGVRLARARQEAEGGAGLTRELEETYPVPEWLQAFLEHSMPVGEDGEAFEMRPLGAQAEVSPERLGEMAGYLGWGKMGAPLRYKPYAEAAERIPEWWEEYTRMSEKLFPKEIGTRRARWYPASQKR